MDEVVASQLKEKNVEPLDEKDRMVLLRLAKR